MSDFNKDDLLGTNSYPAVVKEILETLKNAEAQTLAGNEILSKTYKSLTESITPLLDLKPFITGAEAIAGDDITLKAVIDFCKKKLTGNADLNYLINLCKEEHFAEMNRMQHPSPQSTIDSIQEYFKQPGSVIEEGIKSGIFDSLKSNLLNKIKSDLDVKTPKKKLNESNALFHENFALYSPIGIKMEDIKNNRVVYLTECDVLAFDRAKTEFTNISESGVLISPAHSRLMHAVQACVYDIEKNTFSLNENWDFALELAPDGVVTVNGTEIPKEKLKGLLLESVDLYNADPMKVTNFNRMKYLHDADNFILLCENQKNLIRFDSLSVVKNLNENTYAIFDAEKTLKGEVPQLLGSSANKENKLFESFIQMSEFLGTIVGNPLQNLFENQIAVEVKKINERDNMLINLNESQKELNGKIITVSKLKNLAEKNSPVYSKLNEQEEVLNGLLDENIKQSQFWGNEFKLR